MAKKVLKTIAWILVGIVVVTILFFGVLFLAKYRPEDVETVSEARTGTKTLSIGDSVKVMTWNTGYASLGETADFFMDGGSMVKTADADQVEENVARILEVIEKQNPDVVFLQEVDLNSSRSNHINQYAEYEAALSDEYVDTFAYNFKVLYIPYPIPNMGQVNSGLATFQKYSLTDSQRIQLYCPFNTFVAAFNLRRCLMVNRVPIENSDKELVVINVHLEAYDSGEGKVKQTAQLKEFIEAEYEKGNYVIAGGDFNQVFSNVDASAYPKISDDMWMPADIDTSVFTSFSAVTDASVPTCRSLDKIYAGADKSNFQYYVIDGFLVSDNLQIDSVESLNLDFVNSDHNPVVLDVTLQ